MGRLFVSGDNHGNYDLMKLKWFSQSEIGKNLTKDDYVVICGDFGLIWNWAETGLTVPSNPNDKKWDDEELNLLKVYEHFPWTTVFVDGNHEHHLRLRSYPVTQWNGGKVHQISDSVIHLMRGQVYEVNGKKWFTFGGAESTDKAWRTPYRSWWPEETPSLEEYNEGIRNLRAHDFKVDYVFSHAMPYNMKDNIFTYRDSVPNPTTEFMLQDFYRLINFQIWCCGHYHLDVNLEDNFRICYNKVVELIEGENGKCQIEIL